MSSAVETWNQEPTPMSIALPYRSLPPTPDTYSAGTVLSRVIDGIGFRFYWATDGLRPDDLTYRSAPSARSTSETLGHIFHLVRAIACALDGQVYERRRDDDVPAFDELRREILFTLQATSGRIGTWTPADFEAHDLRVMAEGEERAWPFWYVINGMLSDAIYHIGQVVLARRAAGNPIHPGVRMLAGANVGNP